MGGTGKKLRAWGVYEFGKGVGDAPGNCDQCAKHFQREADSLHKIAIQRAERTAIATGVMPDISVDPPAAKTPCGVCPKMALWPDWQLGRKRGLDPRNELAAELYYYAREDQRIGVFDSAPLMRTVELTGVAAILDEFSVYLPTWLARQNMLTKILVIDQVATQVRSEEEERRRKSREATAKADAERNKEMGHR